MKHLLKYTEWKTASGYYVCNDTEDLANGSGYWWLPARMMEMSPAQYAKWVIDNFKPDSIFYTNDCSVISWRWKDLTKMRKFKNTINRIAREKNFMI